MEGLDIIGSGFFDDHGMRAGEFWQSVGCTEKGILLLGVICCILLSILWLI